MMNGWTIMVHKQITVYLLPHSTEATQLATQSGHHIEGRLLSHSMKPTKMQDEKVHAQAPSKLPPDLWQVDSKIVQGTRLIRFWCPQVKRSHL